jgi:quinol monooxygenase YgiN
MAARRLATAAGLAILVLACCTAASRVPSSFAPDIVRQLEDDTVAGFHDLSILQSLLWGHSRHHRSNKGKKWDGQAFVVFKYYVPPSKADDFVSEWKKLEDSTRGEKRNIIYDLKKTIDDNVVFFGYAEWEDEESFKDHLSQGYTRDFFDFLLDEDIPLRWQPLFKVTDDVRKGGKSHDKIKHEGKDRAHVIIRYTVPPSEAEDFVDTWRQAADRVEKDEDAAVTYSLRKVATNNLEWYVYGTWESYEDYYNHFHSKHIQKLREWNADHDIIWRLSPLIRISKEKE